MAWLVASWVLAGAILTCLLAAAVTDLADRIIPNGLVLVVLCCSVGLRLIAGPGPFWASLLAAAAVLAALSPLGANNLIGWGDVKLIAAVSFVVHVSQVLPMLLAIAITGGLLSCVYLALRFVLRRASPPEGDGGPRGRGAGRMQRTASRESERIIANEPMPYALAVLGGVTYALAAG